MGKGLKRWGLHIKSKNHQIGRVKVPSWLPLLLIENQKVTLVKLYNSDEIIAIVGAPEQARAYVFAYDFTTELWKEESILRPFNVETSYPF